MSMSSDFGPGKIPPHYPVVTTSGQDVSNALISSANASFPTVSLWGFTATGNPFLFPRNLLDCWADDIDPELPAGSYDVQNQFVDVAHFQSDSSKDSPRWWLVHTKPRQEKKLAQQLESIDAWHYLPVTKCKAVTRGRTRVTWLPQFPSYMFLWADSDQRRKALETNRIVATHSVENQRELGGQLLKLADLIEKGVPLRLEERLAPGQQVRIKSGLLKDLTGSVIKRGGKTRLFVNVSEMLGGVSLEIEQHLLEPY